MEGTYSTFKDSSPFQQRVKARYDNLPPSGITNPPCVHLPHVPHTYDPYRYVVHLCARLPLGPRGADRFVVTQTTTVESIEP